MKKNHSRTPKTKPVAKNFDPFNDRLSRDIRNSLSEAFVESLVRREKSEYRQAAEKWRSEITADLYRDYIKNRLLRYDRVFDQINAEHIDDPLLQFIVIWNNELFFEVHDHLERIWTQTVGEQRLAIKGLIKAAGVYIHMECNRQKAAASLSVKSLDLITRHSHRVAFIANLGELTEKLRNLDPGPPRLENTSFPQD